MNAEWLNDPAPPYWPDDLEGRLRDELDDREKLIWAGRPIAGRMALRALPALLFGIPFTGFALFWITWASRAARNGPGFALFGVPLVVVGLSLIASPVLAWFNAGRTSYGVTDRRAIVREPGLFGAQVRSYTPQGLGSMTRVQQGDGSGDLIFEEVLSSSGRHRRVIRRGFLAIDDVRSVETLIRSKLLSRD